MRVCLELDPPLSDIDDVSLVTNTYISRPLPLIMLASNSSSLLHSRLSAASRTKNCNILSAPPAPRVALAAVGAARLLRTRATGGQRLDDVSVRTGLWFCFGWLVAGG